MSDASRLTVIVLLLVAGCGSPSPVQSESRSRKEPPPVAELDYPIEVTDPTRANEAALAQLETPGEVLFADDFDRAGSFANYFEVRGAKDGSATVVLDPALAHSSAGALQLISRANGGRSSGAGVSGWFGPRGRERVHLRYYLRFAADYDQGNLNHTGGCLVAAAGDNEWAGMGTAGIRPAGDDHFSSSFESWRDWGRVASPGSLHLYTYWMDMRIDRDGHYWGNMFQPPQAARIVPERGRWHCYELMIRCNEPGRANGELAAWFDGALYAHFKGFRWRSTDAVALKRFGLDVYVHSATKDNLVWYDDVVLSTGYVGPRR